MVRNSRARAMVQQQPDTKSGGSGHPGVVDPTNLGIDLRRWGHYVASDDGRWNAGTSRRRRR
jgi:hypothetical protein